MIDTTPSAIDTAPTLDAHKDEMPRYRRRQSMTRRKAQSSRTLLEYPATSRSRSPSFALRRSSTGNHSMSRLTEDHEATVVTFGSIEIIELPVELGDNPSVSSGAPITLGWEALNRTSFQLDFYELHRPVRRTSRRSLLISSNARERFLLRNGYDKEEIQKAAVEARQIKRERHETTTAARVTNTRSICSPPLARRSKVRGMAMLGSNVDLRLNVNVDDDDDSDDEIGSVRLTRCPKKETVRNIVDDDKNNSTKGLASPTSVSAFDRHRTPVGRGTAGPRPPIRCASPAMSPTSRKQPLSHASPPVPTCVASRSPSNRPPSAPVRMASPLVSSHKSLEGPTSSSPTTTSSSNLAAKMRSTLPPPPAPSPGSPTLRKCGSPVPPRVRRMC